MTRQEKSACSLDAGLPDCGSGPAGRLSFVLREARAAWRRRRTAASTLPDDRTDPQLKGTQ